MRHCTLTGQLQQDQPQKSAAAQSLQNSSCDLLFLHQGLDFILHLTQLEVNFPLMDAQLTQILPHVLCIPCSHLLTATSCA